MTAVLGWFGGVWNWIQSNPVVGKIMFWGGLALSLFFGAKVYKSKVENATRKKVEAEMTTKFQVESARAETRVVETIRTIEKETRHEAEIALETRDAVLDRPVPDVVRNAPDHIFKD